MKILHKHWKNFIVNLQKEKPSIFRIFSGFLTLLFLILTIVAVVVANRFEPPVSPQPRPAHLDVPSFLSEPVQAESVVVFDAVQSVAVYEQGGRAIQPLASLVKIMTALVALENAPRDTQITLSAEAIAQEGNNFLSVGEVWRLDDLVEYMLITSSNDAAYEIAQSIFIRNSRGIDVFLDAMNDKAFELVLPSLRFESPSGLDMPGPVTSATGSAYDVARLLDYAFREYPDIFMASATHQQPYFSTDQQLHVAQNTNVVVERIPALLASKTGFTDVTGGNLTFMFEAGPHRPIIVVILGSTFEGRFKDAELLVDAILLALQNGEE